MSVKAALFLIRTHTAQVYYIVLWLLHSASQKCSSLALRDDNALFKQKALLFGCCPVQAKDTAVWLLGHYLGDHNLQCICQRHCTLAPWTCSKWPKLALYKAKAEVWLFGHFLRSQFGQYKAKTLQYGSLDISLVTKTCTIQAKHSVVWHLEHFLNNHNLNSTRQRLVWLLGHFLKDHNMHSRSQRHCSLATVRATEKDSCHCLPTNYTFLSSESLIKYFTDRKSLCCTDAVILKCFVSEKWFHTDLWVTVLNTTLQPQTTFWHPMNTHTYPDKTRH